MKIIFFIALLFTTIFIFSCKKQSTSTTSTVIQEYSGTPTGSATRTGIVGGQGPFQYTFDVGSTPKDLYYVFTNTSDTNETTPSVSNSTQSQQESNSTGTTQKAPLFNQLSSNISKTPFEQGLRGLPKARDFHANLPKINYAQVSSPQYNITPVMNTVGDPFSFRDTSAIDLIPATLRSIQTDAPISVNVWVADNAWAGSGCTKNSCITQTIADTFGQRFLGAGDNNDIYDWVTKIFGKPWGLTTAMDLIPESSKTSIDILFYDISKDNSTTGGVLGFYWAKDNFMRSAYNNSNERLIFYMDSVLASTVDKDNNGSDLPWSITHKWPSEILSTLAHEFQHMIHFYQKNILRASGASTETWLNEMLSMVTEDLIADKMLAKGPRGVDYSDETAGSSGNKSGRLPLFILAPYIGVTDWLSGNNVLFSYATSYSLGAFIARSYGGADVIQRIVQNGKTGSDAITAALTDLEFSDDFSLVLQKWGAATLLSETPNRSAVDGNRYNRGSYFTSSVNGINYNLGSINMFNYKYLTQEGPYLFSDSNLLSDLGAANKNSNIFFQVAQGVTGKVTRTINMSSGTKLSIVIK